jgi:chromate transport protein ChrA
MRMLLRLLSIILVIVLRFHPEIAKTIQMIQLLVGFFFFFFFFFLVFFFFLFFFFFFFYSLILLLPDE